MASIWSLEVAYEGPVSSFPVENKDGTLSEVSRCLSHAIYNVERACEGIPNCSEYVWPDGSLYWMVSMDHPEVSTDHPEVITEISAQGCPPG